LDRFRFVVHGLELKHLVEGLDADSFDDFVRAHLNPYAPTGNDFIPLYFYFFHKKTVISASVVSEALTATFGRIGIILDVPTPNLLFCGDQDIHTPTDKDFYNRGMVGFDSQGEMLAAQLSMKFPMQNLEDLMPTVGAAAQSSSVRTRQIASRAEYTQTGRQQITTEDIEQMLRAKGITNPSPEAVERARARSQAMWDSLGAGLAEASGHLDEASDGTLTAREELSSYNEIGINPALMIGDRKSCVRITGVFIRTAEEGLEGFLREQHVARLMQVAESFDLPVVFINDGGEYKTDL